MAAYTLCSKKSDAKIQITITAALRGYLILIRYAVVIHIFIHRKNGST